MTRGGGFGGADSAAGGGAAVGAVSGAVTGAEACGAGRLRRGAKGIGTTGFGAGVSTRLSGVAWGAWATNSRAGAAVLERRYSHAPSSVTHTMAAAARIGIGLNHRLRAGAGTSTGAAGDTG